jgi:DNA-binding HxlR family transcriptional regulator
MLALVTRNHPACPAMESIVKVGNELRLGVISCLLDRPMRYNELLRAAAGIDSRSLSRVLKYLGSERIVERVVLDTRPFMVQYSLTEKGKQLKPVVESLRIWGERWLVPQTSLEKEPTTLTPLPVIPRMKR